MNRYIFPAFCFCLFSLTLFGQTDDKPKRHLSLRIEDVIKLSREQSPQAIRAKHEFRANYWEFRTYKANRLPNLILNATPISLNRSNERVIRDDGSETFVERSSLSTDAELSLNQTVGFTGGTIFVNSGLNRIEPLTAGQKIIFNSSPIISLGFQQPLNGYNAMKWEKKVEPLKYERAKRQYLYEMENVVSRAINLYFNLALAQLNKEIAETNFSNADTLYKIAQGRFNIGTIAENELLQMELSKLNSATELNRATIDLIHKKALLGSFLGYNETVDIQIILPLNVTPPTLSYDRVLLAAQTNNPLLLSYELQILQAEQEVARTSADRRFTANLYAQYGLNKSADELKNVYKDPDDMQMVQFGMRIPIVDWGLGKGKHKMAQSNRELIKTVIDQQRTEFEQDVFLKVMQFSLQGEQIKTASKADTVAQLRYELSKQRFLIGKISITDLNIALNEKDIARRGYINTIQSFFNNLYDIRKLCLFDFETNKAIEENFDELEK